MQHSNIAYITHSTKKEVDYLWNFPKGDLHIEEGEHEIHLVRGGRFGREVKERERRRKATHTERLLGEFSPPRKILKPSDNGVLQHDARLMNRGVAVRYEPFEEKSRVYNPCFHWGMLAVLESLDDVFTDIYDVQVPAHQVENILHLLQAADAEDGLTQERTFSTLEAKAAEWSERTRNECVVRPRDADVVNAHIAFYGKFLKVLVANNAGFRIH